MLSQQIKIIYPFLEYSGLILISMNSAKAENACER
jgi:hypothetical protein